MYVSAIRCDEFIEETETIPRSVNEESITCKKTKFLCSTCLFINCHCIFDSCQYLLLCDKISGKTKTLITLHDTNNELKQVCILII